MSNQDSTNHFPTSGAGTWVFDKEVTDCFDDMLDKSVPCYSHALGVFLRYIATQMNLSSTVKVLDLGVSTAAYFRAMKARFQR
jgi:hypothetical protein